jgi:DNA repair exonuclease SbcCD nuclease subunit
VLHGPVPDEEIADDFPIEPEQVRRTGLDYLALGHWHKPSRDLVDGAERIAYAGSHEPTAFGEVSPDGLTRSGQCLVVSIESPRAIPVIEAHRTAWLTWESRQAHLASAEDLADLRTRVDSEPEESRSRTLLQLKLEGVLPISTSAALADLETLARARFLHARLERDEVKLRTDDLTWIEQLPTGPAVNVARALLEQAQGSGREAAVAREALFLLDELRDGTP